MKTRFPITKLSLNLEVYAYALPVTLLAYFAIVAGGYLNTIIQFLIAAVIGSLTALFPSLFFRWMRLKRAFALLGADRELSDNDYMSIKKTFLLHPRYESLSALVRYPAGVGAAIACLAFFGILSWSQLVVMLLAMVMAVPVNMVFFMFQTEVSMAEYLDNPKLARVTLSGSEFQPISIFMKINSSLLSVILVPIVIFGTFLIEMRFGLMESAGIEIHIGIITVLLLATTMSAGYFFARSLRLTIRRVGDSVNRIAEGNIQDIMVPMISSDEIGVISMDMNHLTVKLRETIAIVMEMMNEMANSAMALANTAEDFSTRSQTTAATVEEVSSTLEEISAGNENIFDTIEHQHNRTKNLIHNLGGLYDIVMAEETQMKNAMEVKSKLDGSIEKVRTKIDTTMELMRNATKDAGDMITYTGSINDISDKTNLLSLNASIEAARAGDSGRGFAVVADEIGRLAEQAGENAKNISNIMRITYESIENSHRSLDEAIGTIEEIFEGLRSFGITVDEVGKLTRKDLEINNVLKEDAHHFLKRSDEIMASMDEQKRAIEEIAKSTQIINDAAQDSSTSSEGLLDSSERVAEKVLALQKAVEFFKL